MSKAESPSLRKRIVAGYDAMLKHEAQLTHRFLTGISKISGLRLFGNRDPDSTLKGKRTPTFALRLDCFETAGELSEALLDHDKIISGAGHFYAKYFAEGLDLMDSGGYVRIGFSHYNTFDEIDRVVQAIKDIAKANSK